MNNIFFLTLIGNDFAVQLLEAYLESFPSVTKLPEVNIYFANSLFHDSFNFKGLSIKLFVAS